MNASLWIMIAWGMVCLIACPANPIVMARWVLCWRARSSLHPNSRCWDSKLPLWAISIFFHPSIEIGGWGAFGGSKSSDNLTILMFTMSRLTIMSWRVWIFSSIFWSMLQADLMASKLSMARSANITVTLVGRNWLEFEEIPLIFCSADRERGRDRSPLPMMAWSSSGLLVVTIGFFLI